jgi:nitronate monooxygenase
MASSHTLASLGSNELLARLGIRHPIIQAPMSGSTTPELVAAVSAAGGLGTLAASGLSVEQLRDAIAAVRRATDRPFGANFILAPPEPAPADSSVVRQRLDRIRDQLGMSRVAGAIDLPPAPLAGQIDLVCELRVPVVSFAMGHPGKLVDRLHAAGIFVVATATTVAEALALDAAGVDAIVAQGAEAGGHRSTFDLPRTADAPLVGTLALVPQVVDAVRVPVIAAGGVMDGRGLVAALALGAKAAQMGTRFLLARESGAFPEARQRLLAAVETDTVLTRQFTGRPARGLRNAFVDAMAADGTEPLPWPYQAVAAQDIYRAAAQRNLADWYPLLAGQGLRLARAEAPAAEIVSSVAAEAREVLATLAR